MVWTIYRVDNLTEKLLYVGCTNHLSDRVKAHRSQKHPCVRGGLYKITVLAVSENKLEASELEKNWVESLRATDPSVGYNERSGGLTGYKYPPHSAVRNKTPERIQKQSQSLKLHWETHEHPMTGKAHSDRSRTKMSVSQKARAARGDVPFRGKKHSEEAKKRMSEAKKNYVPWNKGISGYSCKKRES